MGVPVHYEKTKLQWSKMGVLARMKPVVDPRLPRYQPVEWRTILLRCFVLPVGKHYDEAGSGFL